MSVINTADLDVNTRRVIARDPGTSPRDLAALAEDEDVVVRLFVSLNPSTPEELKDINNVVTPNSANRIFGLYYCDAESGAWVDDEWMYHVGPNDPTVFYRNAVIFNEDGRDDYGVNAPWWWNETVDFISQLDFACDLGDFLEMYQGNEKYQQQFEIYDDEWEQALIDLYNAYEDTGDAALQFKFDAVKILHPDTEFRQVTADHPNYPDSWVTVFYDFDSMDEVYQDTLQTWYFWLISEACSRYLDLGDLEDEIENENPDRLNGMDIWDLFEHFGDYTDDYELFPDSELPIDRGQRLKFFADLLGYDVDECVLL